MPDVEPRTADERGQDVSPPPSGPASCPVCTAPAADPFVRLGDLPVRGSTVFATPQEARAVPVGDQELTLCGSCGVVFNSAFDPALVGTGQAPGGEHEESRHRSPRFAGYAEELAAAWVHRHRLRGEHVVEVGCGAGHFAAGLLRAGAWSVTGIDPRFRPERVPPGLADRLHAVPAFFAPELVEAGTAALVCRHTIDHVPDPAEFGAALVAGMRGAGVPALLAEVPDLGRILVEGAFWDLQYEHRSYFTPDTFAGYLARSGLTVDDVRTAYAGQYVVAEARVAPDGDTVDSTRSEVAPAELERLHELCESFGFRAAGRLAHWAHWLESRASAGDPVAVWGGGAKGLTFLNMLATHTGPVAAVVDVDPGLRHRYIGGVGHPIVAPADLKPAPPRSVLLMNPVYEREVRARLDDLGLGTTELVTV